MKNIMLGVVVGAGLALAGSAGAAAVLVQSRGAWGEVLGPTYTSVYRINDTDNGATCYVAYFGDRFIPDMECVK